MYRTRSLLAAAVVCVLTGQVFAADLSFETSTLTARRNAKVEASGNSVRLKVDDPGWDSGLVVTPKSGSHLDLSHWDVLVVDVENLSKDKQARLLMQITADGPEKREKKDFRDFNVGVGLNPGEKRTLRLKIPHRWKYGAPNGIPGVRALDTTEILRIEFFMQWPFEKVEKGLLDIKLTNLRGEGALTPTVPVTEAQYVPFIDQYGQFVHGSWPEKITSPADHKKFYDKEQAELAKVKAPEEWNKYGGWKNGPQLKATGSFRTEKVDGKWWLVDPEGRLFFSQGLDVISNYNDPLKVVPGKENWFVAAPADGKMQPTEPALRNKYGANYADPYFKTLSRRLTAWGMNTIGDWSQNGIIEQGDRPYTMQLTDYDYKMPKFGTSKLKFYDVFDPKYVEKMKNLVDTEAERNPALKKSLTDPMCIGYWIDNELDFGNRNKLTLIDDILKCGPKQAAKQELVKDMKAKYADIAKLNAAWKTTYASFDAILESTTIPEGDGYKEDSKIFFEKTVNRYFELAHDAIKSKAPNRLYLGCRFIGTDGVRKVLYDAASKYCDVVSVNIYSHSAANYPSTADGLPDKPWIIGEFHFGVLDRGMFNPSLCNVGITQEDRAIAYTRFMQGVLAHPNFVGAHWFQYRDQPLTGRGDGEAYQIGFVDVNDTPYVEIGKAARQVGEQMYSYRKAGKLVDFK